MPWLEQLEQANWGEASCLAVLAYFLGCFTTGFYLVRKRTGQDLREIGTGNVGARNAGRVLGWPGFTLTLAGDFAKGALAVWAAQHYTQDYRLVAVALLAVVVGHLWPAQLRFHGGKGVATSLGGLLVFDYHLAIPFMLLFVAGYAVARRTVLAGLFALCSLPLVSIYQAHQASKPDPGRAIVLTILSVLILAAHWKNLLEEFSHFIERRQIQPKQHPPEI
jgi:glycerol-3-phosphate acyltransferase PlsY